MEAYMYWTCEVCNEWGASDSEVEAAVDRLRHLDAHNRPSQAPDPEEEENEDTVLNLRYLAWGTTIALGLLSSHWHALAGLVPFAAVISLVLTHTEK
jgi:hypothetical protein